MKEIFASYPLLAWSVVSTLLAAVVIAALWDRVKWWAHNTWYKFPVIGKLRTLSRDGSPRDESGFSKPERVLCDDYLKFMTIQDEHDFNEKKTYLRKAGEISRRDLPFWLWLLIVAMVVVEAFGFSYVLAGFTIPGASENVQQLGAYGIAFLVSVILVAFTHFAGHELYVSSEVNNARRERKETGLESPLYTEKISLDRDQSLDDHLPAHCQLMNRYKSRHASYKISILTAILVVSVAAGATYVRGQVLEDQLLQETMATAPAAPVNAAGDAFNMDQPIAVPDADAQSHDNAQQLGQEQSLQAKKHGGWGTFIVLAFIFVFLQILGVLFGFKFGFGAEQSREAYRSTGRFARYADARAHYDHIANTAQAMLESLQQRLSEHGAAYGSAAAGSSRCSFRQYLACKREEMTADLGHQRTQSSKRQQIERTTPPAPATAANTFGQTMTADAAIAHFRSLHDHTAQLEFVSSLSDELADAVLAAEEARQAEQNDNARRKAERLARLKGLQS